MSARVSERRQIEIEREYTLDDDGLVADLAWNLAQRDPDAISFEYFGDDGIVRVSAREHLARVIDTARGLIAAGLPAGGRVALMAETRYEWVLIDMAIWAAGGVTVPIYPSSSSAQVEWIVTNSGAHLVIAGDRAEADIAGAAEIGETEILVIDDGAVAELARRGEGVDAAEVDRRRGALTLDDPASIVYTSGTTGRPKGCVLSHRNLIAECKGILAHPIGVAYGQPGRRSLMFLPLAHVLARAVTYTVYMGGATVGFWSDFSTIVDKFGAFHPDVILGVPRVFEKVHDGIRSNAQHAGKLQAQMFDRARRVAIDWSTCRGGDGLGDARRPGLLLRAQYAVFDRLVYSKVRAAMGGACECAISGGGPLSAELGHFFRGIGVPIYEGYGLTESSAAITVNGPGVQRIGTVGLPLSGNAVRLTDDGEIELHGDVVFQEYWQNADATKEALNEGWFRTGDLGRLDADGCLSIVGRRKEILVTAGGKNVAPAPMEDVLRQHPAVGNAMVIGDNRPFIAALIPLDPEGAQQWADAHGVSVESLPENADLHAELQAAVDRANAGVSRAESIRKFEVLPEDFSEATGEMTPTMKIKRHVVTERHADLIDRMYAHR